MPEIEALAKLRQAYQAMSASLLKAYRELEELRANYQLSLAREKNTAEMAFKFLQERKEAMEYAAWLEGEDLRMREALEWYADEKNYQWGGAPGVFKPWGTDGLKEFEVDWGKRARAALVSSQQ